MPAEFCERFDRFFFAFKNRFHPAIWQVAYPAFHVYAVGFALCCGPEEYTLNLPAQEQMNSDFHDVTVQTEESG